MNDRIYQVILGTKHYWITLDDQKVCLLDENKQKILTIEAQSASDFSVAMDSKGILHLLIYTTSRMLIYAFGNEKGFHKFSLIQPLQSNITLSCPTILTSAGALHVFYIISQENSHSLIHYSKFLDYGSWQGNLLQKFSCTITPALQLADQTANETSLLVCFEKEGRGCIGLYQIQESELIWQSLLSLPSRIEGFSGIHSENGFFRTAAVSDGQLYLDGFPFPCHGNCSMPFLSNSNQEVICDYLEDGIARRIRLGSQGWQSLQSIYLPAERLTMKLSPNSFERTLYYPAPQANYPGANRRSANQSDEGLRQVVINQGLYLQKMEEAQRNHQTQLVGLQSRINELETLLRLYRQNTAPNQYTQSSVNETGKILHQTAGNLPNQSSNTYEFSESDGRISVNTRQPTYETDNKPNAEINYTQGIDDKDINVSDGEHSPADDDKSYHLTEPPIDTHQFPESSDGTPDIIQTDEPSNADSGHLLEDPKLPETSL